MLHAGWPLATGLLVVDAVGRTDGEVIPKQRVLNEVVLKKGRI